MHKSRSSLVERKELLVLSKAATILLLLDTKSTREREGVKLRVFSQGSRRDFCLRNSILILQVVVPNIALKARVPRQRKICNPNGYCKKGVHALHVLPKSSSSMEEHVYVWSWDLTEMNFGETLTTTKESKKLQYFCFFFPATSPRSVQCGGGGQLNKLRRMGIL
ncbi:hypothetical protein CY35_11G112600 [Sphagnum magellanicum]|nr:hypothetical protein CY35_11G112600 [Sphagnum magellanicum]